MNTHLIAPMSSFIKCPRRCFARHLRGFTLVESVIAMAVATTLLVVAAPSMSWLMNSIKLNSATELFMSGLNLARSEAIKRNGQVVLCKSANGGACANTGGWDQGWIVFDDTNRNGLRDDDEQIIRHEQPLPAGLSLTGNLHVANYVSYEPTGVAKLVGGGFQAGTLTVCRHSVEAGEARQIVVNAGGRPRIQKATVDICN